MALKPQKIVLIVSAVIGLLLLLASGLYGEMYYNSPFYKTFCKGKETEDVTLVGCNTSIYYMAGAFMGFVAGLTQILAAAICRDKLRCWCVTSFFVFLFAVIAFALPLDKEASSLGARALAVMQLDEMPPTEGDLNIAKVKINFFLAISAINAIFTLGAFVYICYAGDGGEQHFFGYQQRFFGGHGQQQQQPPQQQVGQPQYAGQPQQYTEQLPQEHEQAPSTPATETSQA